METKDNGTKGKDTDFGCCNPEDFKKMFEKMSKCSSGQGDAPDFSAMKRGMMKKMKHPILKRILNSKKSRKGKRNPLKRDEVVLNCQ
jgi:hypothetical protein